MTDTNQPEADAAEQPILPRIIVGVDGSDPSLQALREAARFARLLGAGIEAIATWTYPVSPGPYTDAEQPLEQLAKETLGQALVDAYGEDRPHNLTAEVEYGQAAHVLVQRSEGAEMLIVGSRGRGGFAGLLLGSVSSACAAHAKCPVLIVR
ncbi:universal stress protein [Humibacter sp. RRB41]|uniref:universal stress protein n=1 Tax=Humibacter sp. RRB41 TaxID=2919946 RepID=UPI001FAAFB00|nr:universal stress protein [Humibacter sp. RRB41]